MEVSGYSYYRALLTIPRNLFVILGIFVFFTGTYLTATEFITAKKSKGEVLLFPRHQRPQLANEEDLEHSSISQRSSNRYSNASRRVSGAIHKQTSVFHWRDICYDIKIKKENRRILNRVDGWVKPGSLTALMVRPPKYISCFTLNICRDN
jgi:ATP-binding cassette subfamily G (WHITE) protein 2 (PDR)